MWDAANQLGYRPNQIARGLRDKSIKAIGFLSFSPIRAVPTAILRGCLAAGWRSGYLVLVGEIGGGRGIEQKVINGMLDRGVDRFIIASEDTQRIRMPGCLRGYPVVLANAVAGRRPDLPSVMPDEFGAGRAVVRSLLGLGHRDGIVFVGASASSSTGASQDRLRGVRKELADIELASTISATVPSPGAAYRSVTAFLAEGSRRPTAFICLNDAVALGVYQAVQETRWRIPQDVSVVSFDNSELSGWMRPVLSGVTVPYFEIGAQAVHLLLEEDRAASHRVPTGIALRESTGPPPQPDPDLGTTRGSPVLDTDTNASRCSDDDGDRSNPDPSGGISDRSQGPGLGSRGRAISYDPEDGHVGSTPVTGEVAASEQVASADQTGSANVVDPGTNTAGPHHSVLDRRGLEVSGSLDVKWLTTFVVVAEELNFRRAGERMALAQAAVSRQITNLEAELGVALFDREPQHIRLTDAGEAFLGPCRDALAAVQQAGRLARNAGTGEYGLIKIGADASATGKLVTLMTAVRQEHPNLKLEIDTSATTAQMVRMIRDDRIDIGLLGGPVRAVELLQTPIGRTSWSLLLPHTHPLAQADELSVHSLEGEHLILVDAVSAGISPWKIKNTLDRSAVSPREITIVGDGLTLLAMVGASLGMGFALDTVSGLPSNIRLVRLAGTPTIPVSAVWKPTNVTPALGTLIRTIDRHLVRPGSAIPSVTSTDTPDTDRSEAT